MKKILVLGLALIGLVFSSVSHAAWNADWKQRVKIGLNTTAEGLPIAAGVDNVPVLVRLHTGNFQFVEAKPDGSDLRFIAGDDKTPLKHHIEKFDSLNELALVWVQVPKLLPGSKAEFIWLYYGNQGAAVADDAKGTYDATQALVYHFSEREAAPQDSTANANQAARSTARVNGAGLIGAGLTFDAASELALPATPSLKSNTNGLTLSMWIKPVDTADAPIYTQTEGASPLTVSIRGGMLVAQSGTITATTTAPVTAGAWQHVAVVAKDGLAIYVNGVESARAAGSVPDMEGAAIIGKGFKGDIDELQVSTVARSADWIKAAAQSQGSDQKLVSYGAAEGEGEGESGPSYIKILLGAVTLDGWVVIGILGVMFVLSVIVMYAKVKFVHKAANENKLFMKDFDKLITSIDPNKTLAESAITDSEFAGAKGKGKGKGKKSGGYGQSQLYRLYVSGVTELQMRFDVYRAKGIPLQMSAASLSAIRATVEATMIREIQRLNSQMVVLTISIAGGPFLGLLGTVVGVMITFAAIAAAGDVNVNAIAPGIAAALVATVAGLAVAIPALFAYNYLTGRIQALTADMQVFVDELTTRIAENHSV
jgi:biopolymer transport protein ExbB